jgi:hypothetical protein
MMHRAIKTHYTSDKYDYCDFHGKIKLKGSTFDNDPTRYHYLNLMKKYDKNKANLTHLFVANLYQDPNIFVGDILQDSAHDLYLDHKSNLESLTYTFKNDITHLREKYGVPIKLLFRGDDPIILQCARSKEISRYSFVILDDILGFTDVIKPADTIIWPGHKKLLKKFSRFVMPFADSLETKRILLDAYK